MRCLRSTIRWGMLLSIGLLGFSGAGCAYFNSFHDAPGQPTVKVINREPVLGSSLKVSVVITDGNFQPMCMLPDAANEISCHFTYGYLEHGMLMNPDGYRYLGLDTARQACYDATWSLGLGPTGGEVVEACARALLTLRWTEDVEYGHEDPNR